MSLAAIANPTVSWFQSFYFRFALGSLKALATTLFDLGFRIEEAIQLHRFSIEANKTTLN